MTKARSIAWIPPLLVGASAAIAAEVAVGILLYAGPGLMRSLTTVLAVEGAALAAGLHSAPSSGSDLLARLRRRWLLCLAAFIAAAMFGTFWSLAEDLGEGRLGQGLGLALLAGLPLYACGAVLGGMGATAELEGSGRLRRPGAAAAFGAALGFVITGMLMPRAPIPASLLVGCLVLLSAAGMTYGVILGAGRDMIGAAADPAPGAGPGPLDPGAAVEPEALVEALGNGEAPGALRLGSVEGSPQAQ